MTKNGCDSKSIKYLANRGEEELNMIKSAYEKKLPKAKYPEPHKSEDNIFKPQTLEEFLEITNKLERQGILSEGYDGYYDEGCTIFVDQNGYYVR